MKKCFILTLVFILTVIMETWAVTGVAFVHGKGKSLLNDPQGAVNYWGTDMIKASTKNYKYPYVVVHYNGESYMWEAAKDTAAQIYQFIVSNQIDDLVIVTHSFGGTVIRFIFSNPDYDSKYPVIISKTRWVNTIAAPALGSEAADLADELSGSWLTGWLVELVGQGTDATKNCTTSKMAEYNRTTLFGTPGRPSLPRTFKWISGYGLWNDFAHTEDYGLAALSGAAGMPGEDDGAVSEYSAQAVGQKWFRTEANHHHNRRNDYKPIGDSIGQDVDGGRGDSTQSQFTALSEIPSWISRGSQNSFHFTGKMNSIRNVAIYKNSSTRYVDFVVVQPGENKKDLPLYLGKNPKSYVAVFPIMEQNRGDFNASISSSTRESMVESQDCSIHDFMGFPAGNFKSFVINNPQQGEHSMTFDSPRSEKSQVYGVVVNSDESPLLTAYLSSDTVFPGEYLTISAQIEDKSPIKGAMVKAEIYKEKSDKVISIPLSKKDSDEKVFTFSVKKLVGKEIADEPGAYMVRISALGRTDSDDVFKRSATLSFRRPVLGAKINTQFQEMAIKKEGKVNILMVKVPVSIYADGRYRLFGTLSAKRDKDLVSIAWAMETKDVTKGDTEYFLCFKGSDISGANLCGPYYLNLSVLSLDRIEQASPSLQDDYVTLPYSINDFVKD